MEKIPVEPDLINSKSNVSELSNFKSRAYAPVEFNPKWVMTQNELRLNSTLNAAKIAGECLVEIAGVAGIGKTTLIRRYASFNDCIYLLCLETWRRSELPMFQALCRELGVARIPARSNDCFLEAAQRLIARPRIVFLDEIDLVPSRINLVRQLAEVVGGIFVLVGEESLTDQLSKNERVWSRTFFRVRLEPASMADVSAYARETSGLEVGKTEARLLLKSSKGKDWRIVKRVTLALVNLANAYETRVVTPEMMDLAVKTGLSGRTDFAESKGGVR